MDWDRTLLCPEISKKWRRSWPSWISTTLFRMRKTNKRPLITPSNLYGASCVLRRVIPCKDCSNGDLVSIANHLSSLPWSLTQFEESGLSFGKSFALVDQAQSKINDIPWRKETGLGFFTVASCKKTESVLYSLSYKRFKEWVTFRCFQRGLDRARSFVQILLL